MSATPSFPDANVRSQTYYVALTSVRCPHCGRSTRLLALAMPRDHETLHAGVHDDASDRDADAKGDADELREESTGDRCEESAPEVWQRAGGNALLFYVEGLPGVVQRRLQQLSRFFYLAYDPVAMNSYWANHCEHCGRLLADHELHCEPEGAFMPANETAAQDIQLLRFQEPFAAAALGYACEPEFFASMRAG
jgi:hypothetical protein